MFKLIVAIKKWNRRRIANKRIAKAIENDFLEKRNIPDPKFSAKNILIIDSLNAFGDSIYTNGLVTELADSGKDITLITFTKTIEVFIHNYKIKSLLKLDSTDDLLSVIHKNFDLIIDLAYLDLNSWKFRSQIIKNINAYTISCAEWTKALNCINETLDLSDSKHISEQLGKIYTRITGKTPPRNGKGIFPHINQQKKLCAVTTPTYTRKKIYVNAIAGGKERSLSESQVLSLISWLNSQSSVVAYVYAPEAFPIIESDSVKLYKGKSFLDLLNFMTDIEAVITPDTSVVHIASALNIPTLALFCGNDKDHFHRNKFIHWAPISDNSMILVSHSSSNVHDLIPVSQIEESALIEQAQYLISEI